MLPNWGECKEEGMVTRKMHLENWDRVFLPKTLGGLNITPIDIKNQALLGKWWHKWYSCRQAECNKLIRAIYRCLHLQELGDTPSIMNVSEMLRGILSINGPKGFNWALSADKFKQVVNDESSPIFWEDLWSGNSRLNQQFTRLFVLSKLKWFIVRDFSEVWFNLEAESDMLWNCDLRAWELEEVLKLNDILDELVLTEGSDQLVWCVTNNPYVTAEGKSFLSKSFIGNQRTT